VLVLELDEPVAGLAAVVVLVLVDVWVLSFVLAAGGFTTVVLVSVFLSAPGEAAGATTSVFCSHAPRSAALAKMQSNFFIFMDWLSLMGQA
jgi:hypothetical protein